MDSIYLITHRQSGKSYVGRTKDPVTRKSQHFTGSSSCRYLSRAIAKYGREAFDFVVLCMCKAADSKEVERKMIIQEGTLAPAGYNLSSGGEGGRHHPDTIALMKQKQQERAKKPHTHCLRVAQYTRDGLLVQTHHGVTEAVRSMFGTNKQTQGAAHSIATAITGVNYQVTAYGFQWRYVQKGAEAQASIAPITKTPGPRWQKVQQCTVEGTVIAEFPSRASAARYVGAKQQNIDIACRIKGRKCRGFIWKDVV